MPWPKGRPATPKMLAGLRAGVEKARTPEAIERRREATRASNRDRVWTPEQRQLGRTRMNGNTLVRDATVKGVCVYCGDPATTRDHVVPGSEPTVLACWPCNAAKGRRTPEEWLALVERQQSDARDALEAASRRIEALRRMVER